MTPQAMQLADHWTEILPGIRRRARHMGYAIAVHGSMARDLDLIAVPWVDRPADPHGLACWLQGVYGRDIAAEPTEAKPTRWRRCWHIITPLYRPVLDGSDGIGCGYIELSVPRYADVAKRAVLSENEASSSAARARNPDEES